MQFLVLSAFVLVSMTIVDARSETYMIPMRDGVKLHTIVDFPPFKEKNLTAVMDRSPYGEDGLERIAQVFTIFGFAGIRQDMRGTHKSQGNFSIWHTADSDAYDTMQWISQQSWSSGIVYSVGVSADGIAAFFQPIDSPPWLHAQFLIFATSVGYEIIYPGGAFRQALTELWLEGTVPGQAGPLIIEVEDNEAPGTWWNSINMTGHYGNVDFPSVLWAGWYDIFQVGQLIGWNGYQYESNPKFQMQSKLVIDPLGHCQSGFIYFDKNLILGRALLPIFLGIDLFTGLHAMDTVNFVTFYVMGPEDINPPPQGNYWTTLPTFPSFVPTPYYIHAGGLLSASPPASNESASTSFIFNPHDPVPSNGGNNLEIACGPLDQRPVENRADVLVYTSAVLTQLVPITGPLNVVLYVSSNATDTDFTVKLTDVHPTGVSRLIEDGIIRMRWRNRYESDQPQLITPGQVYEVQVSLWNTSYVFNPGHRIRVDISSSNDPRFSVNPNNGLPLSQNATGAWLVAENTVYHTPVYPTQIILPVVTMAQLPPFHVVSSLPKVYATPLMEHYKVDTLEELEDRLVEVVLGDRILSMGF